MSKVAWETRARNRSEAEHPCLWDGLLALWTPCLGASGGTLFDVSGRGRRAALTGGTWGKSSPGSVITLSGSQYGVAEHATAITWPVTLFGLFSLSATTNRVTVVSLSSGTGDDFLRLTCDSDSGGYGMTAQLDIGGSYTNCRDSTLTFATGQWIFGVGVYTPTTVQRYVWQNGALVSTLSVANATGASVPPVVAWTVGSLKSPKYGGEYLQSFPGSIAMAGVYGRALSLAEASIIARDAYAIVRRREPDWLGMAAASPTNPIAAFYAAVRRFNEGIH